MPDAVVKTLPVRHAPARLRGLRRTVAAAVSQRTVEMQCLERIGKRTS